MGPSQISDTPLRDLSRLYIYIYIILYRFGAHKGTCSSESVLLDIHGVVRREGKTQKRQASPCMFVSLAAFTSLPCMFH